MDLFGKQKKQIDTLTKRLRAQDALIEELARRAGVGAQELAQLREQIGPSVSLAVKDLVAQGKMVAAIKQHRVDTGAGLVEAKETVEEFARS